MTLIKEIIDKSDIYNNASKDNILNNNEGHEEIESKQEEKRGEKGKKRREEEREEKDENLMIISEHLQLTTEEAFFLCFGIGTLDIFDSNNVIIHHDSKPN